MSTLEYPKDTVVELTRKASAMLGANKILGEKVVLDYVMKVLHSSMKSGILSEETVEEELYAIIILTIDDLLIETKFI